MPKSKSWVIPFRCHADFAMALNAAAKRKSTSRNQLIVETLSTALGIPVPAPLPKGLAGASKATRKEVYRASVAAKRVQA